MSSTSEFPLKTRLSGQTRHHYDGLLFSYILGFFFPPYTGYFGQINTAVWVESSGPPIPSHPPPLRRLGKQAREHEGDAAACCVKADMVFHPHCGEGGNYPTCSPRTGDKTTMHEKVSCWEKLQSGLFKEVYLAANVRFPRIREPRVQPSSPERPRVLCCCRCIVLHVCSELKICKRIYDMIQSSSHVAAVRCVKSYRYGRGA